MRVTAKCDYCETSLSLQLDESSLGRVLDQESYQVLKQHHDETHFNSPIPWLEKWGHQDYKVETMDGNLIIWGGTEGEENIKCFYFRRERK